MTYSVATFFCQQSTFTSSPKLVRLEAYESGRIGLASGMLEGSKGFLTLGLIVFLIMSRIIVIP